MTGKVCDMVVDLLLFQTLNAASDGGLQEVAGDLNGQRICNHASSALVVFHPGWVRQRNPYWTAADQELDVYSIRMARGHGDYQGLVNAVQPLTRPAVGSVKVLKHSV